MQTAIPDTDFIKQLKQRSGSGLSTCMQCGACTAVCELSPADNPFPRKEMIWASWGLKNKLMGDPDVWLCHHCGDCTATCPREVKPGEVLSAVRHITYASYSRPGFLARMLSNPLYLPLVVGVPALIILTIIAMAGTFGIPEGKINYSAFFPHGWLNISFTAITLLSFSGLAWSIRDFRRDILRHLPGPTSQKGQIRNFMVTIRDIVLHTRFKKCRYGKYQYYAHFMVFAGFILLLLVTLFAILSTLFFEYPLPFLHPAKIAGNAAALLLLSGGGILIAKRITGGGKINNDYTDWFFLIILYLLVITGVLVEMARFLDWAPAYHIYFIHLELVWLLIIYAPYTKFAHVVYRTMAMAEARRCGRI